MARYFSFGALLVCSLSAQTIDRPVRAVTDPGVVTTRQTITPAGVPTVFQGKVYGVAFGESAERLWVLSTTQLYEMDWRANRVLVNLPHGSTPGLQGIAFRQRPFLTAVPRRKGAALFTVDGAQLQAVAGEFGANNTGSPGFGGKLAVVPLISENKVAVIDLSSKQVIGKVETGIAPFAAVVNAAGTVAYVSNWGGRRAVAGDKTARTGLDPKADEVVVDAQGIASTGTITRIDLTTLRATHSLPSELHPNGLAWDEKNQRLYAANNNRDSITVIDTRTNTLLRHVPIQPFQRTVTGVAPTAVVLSPDGARLFVTCGGINAVAVLNTKTFALEGLIPTGWYPSTLSLSPDGKYLAVGSLLGAGSGWRDAPAKRFVHSYRGSVNVLPIPDGPQLASYTTAVSENNHLPLKGAAAPANPVTQGPPRAVPVRAGDPSLIQHVVYIVKENRTYDQVLGDLAKGNGDPSLAMFGKSVTPNQHRLADEFVTLDNFYASGGNSADGHQWVTQANEVAYTLYPGYEGRSYPFDGTDPIAIAQGGTIWDSALRLGKQVRIFGEYAGRRPEPATERPGYLRRWKDREDFTSTFSATAPIAHMNAFLARNYPPYCISIPDVIRAQIFLKEFRQWESQGKMPHLTIIQLPSNHTYGTSPGASTASAMVADNDLALGQIVESLSHSQFWPKMAIFVVEDDAQNGVDHVDGHRTVALAISPYTRRGHVDSTFYSHQSMLKTIELMLGLPTLSLFDLIATEMRASFTDTPDLRPYSHSPATHDLFEVNPPLKALRGEARQAAQASAKMRWDVPDAVPTERLNRILWHSIKGWATPYPGVRQSVFAPYSLDIDDDDR
jgi:YVTN family beta-propeller protein